MTRDCSRLSDWMVCEPKRAEGEVRPDADAPGAARLDPALAARSIMADSLNGWLLSHISVASRDLGVGGAEAEGAIKLDSTVLSLPPTEAGGPKKLESIVLSLLAAR